jgi:hypothetical protein
MATVIFKRENDDDHYLYATEFYGEFSDKPQPYCIDREQGFLLGQEVEEPEGPEEPESECPWVWEHWGGRDRLIAKGLKPPSLAVLQEWEQYDQEYDKYQEAWNVWNENWGCEVLEEGLPRRGQFESRYFIPAHFDPETDKPERITRLYDRVCEFGNWWWLEFWSVEVINEQGETVQEDSIGWIESDGGKEYAMEILADLLHPIVLSQDTIQDLLDGDLYDGEGSQVNIDDSLVVGSTDKKGA